MGVYFLFIHSFIHSFTDEKSMSVVSKSHNQNMMGFSLLFRILIKAVRTFSTDIMGTEAKIDMMNR